MAAQRTASAYPRGYRSGERGADLAGIAEIAERYAVSRAVAGNWALRWADFPTPLAVLECGAVYSLVDVRFCLGRHGKVERIA